MPEKLNTLYIAEMLETNFHKFSGFSKSLEWMKTISIFKYWDYSSVIIDDFFKAGDFVVLTILAIVLLIIGIWIFEKKDIPA